MRTPRRLIGIVIAAAALLAVPASAQALSLSGLVAAPASTQAGAHSNFHLHMDFSGGQVKDLTVGLPPGQIGDPNATPLCTVSPAQRRRLPRQHQGRQRDRKRHRDRRGAVPVTVDVNGDLYNLTPQPGEPARFGIVLRPRRSAPCPALLSRAFCRRSSSSRASSSGPTSASTRSSTTSPTRRSGLRHDDQLAGHHALRDRSGDRQAVHAQPDLVRQQHDQLLGRSVHRLYRHRDGELHDDQLRSPRLLADVDGRRSAGPGRRPTGCPTTASTTILQDNDEAGLLKAKVKVPSDFNPNSGLFFAAACDQASFAAGNCPANTVVGLATAASPLLSQPLIGNVTLVPGQRNVPQPRPRPEGPAPPAAPGDHRHQPRTR